MGYPAPNLSNPATFMSTRDHIGELIREQRLARGFSLGQLATKLGKPPAVVRSWERGEDGPDRAMTAALIEALDLDAAQVDALVTPDAIEVADPEVDIERDAAGAAATEAAPAESEDARDVEAEQAEDAAGDADDALEAVAVEVTDAAATAPSVAADHEPLDVEESTAIDDAAEPEVPDDEPEVPPPPSDVVTEHAAVIPAVGPTVDEPTEAMPAPVTTITPAESPPTGYDVIEPVVAETPARPPITVPPLRLPNPIRLLFDPHHRYLYWIRYALTLVVLFILVRVFVWAGGELWTALGDFLDTFRATDSEEEQALRFVLRL